jgi:exonuclease VII large subunit
MSQALPSNGITTSTAGYEPIPDVEPSVVTSSSSSSSSFDYSGLDPQQMELMSTLDDTIQKNNTSMLLQLQLPAIDPQVMVTQGQSWVTSMILPTMTAIGTTVTALVLSAVHQMTNQSNQLESSISSLLIQLFPYFNAVVVFLSSFAPIQQRCMTSVQPILEQVGILSDTITTAVQNVTQHVDTTLDTLQTQVQTTLTPLLPTLQTATQYEQMIRQIQPNIDIPDATDIEEEFQEARTVLQTPMEQATTTLRTISTQAVPAPFQSATKFYWYIVFPMAVLVLSTQLGVVVYTTRRTSTTTVVDTAAPTMNNMTTTASSYLLRGSSTNVFPNVSVPLAISFMEPSSSSVHDVTLPSSSTQNITETEQQLLTQKDELMTNMNATLDNVTTTLLHNSVQEYEQEYQNVKSNMEQQVQNQMQDYQEQVQGYEQNMDETITQSIGPAKAMIQSVILSYLMVVLQMGIVYLMTSPMVKAYLMNCMMQQATAQVDATLRRTGVPAAMDDIFGTRLGRIRTKLMKVFTAVQQIQSLLQQLGLASSGDNNGGGSGNPVKALTGAASSLSNRFGFGK